MKIKKEIDVSNYEIGVIVGRFQVHELHDGHKALIKKVRDYHNKVIIFLGVSAVSGTKSNPLDFATRKLIIEEYAPDAVILPLKDERSDEVWSQNLDNMIKLPFGEKSAIIYGSRNSFINSYSGKYKTVELLTNIDDSGTKKRDGISKEYPINKDFRKGIIYNIYNRRPITWSTVDVCVYNDDGNILLAKKPNEDKWRFVGGFLDRTDSSDESAAIRELKEELGHDINISELKYVTSAQIDDWRYKNTGDGIMTRMFLAKYLWGNISANDDISETKWFDVELFKNEKYINNLIMPEHHVLMKSLIEKEIETIIKKNEN